MEVQPKDTSRGHNYVSLAKSAVRLVAASCCIGLGYGLEMIPMLVGGVLFFAAEVLGVVEELV